MGKKLVPYNFNLFIIGRNIESTSIIWGMVRIESKIKTILKNDSSDEKKLVWNL